MSACRLGLFLLILVGTSQLAHAEVGAVYRCIAKDAIDVDDTGMLGRDKVTEYKRKQYDGIIIDTLTGALTWSDRKRDLWRVIQRGTGENDHILIANLLLDNPPDEWRLIHASEYFIRVRDWPNQQPAKFISIDFTTIISGTCDRIR